MPNASVLLRVGASAPMVGFMARGIVAVLALALALTGCAGSTESDSASATEDVSEPSERPTVDWENHAPSVRKRIDRAEERRDCRKLQREFDTAESNSERQRARTGDSNADLMDYIAASLEAAGCYE